jgi:hypothetical protein
MFLTLLLPLPLNKNLDRDTTFRAGTKRFFAKGTEPAGRTGIYKVAISSRPGLSNGKTLMAAGTADKTAGFGNFMIWNSAAGAALRAGYLHIPIAPGKVMIFYSPLL